MTYKPATKPRPEELVLREVALSYPEATEDFPWDHRAMKVKGKTFAWMGTAADGSFFFTAKLPSSHGGALMLPFATPTGYGLARSGWVSAGFQAGEEIPVGLFRDWLEESYRAVAPKTLVKRMGEAPVTTSAAPRRSPPKKAPPKKKSPPKRDPPPTSPPKRDPPPTSPPKRDPPPTSPPKRDPPPTTPPKRDPPPKSPPKKASTKKASTKKASTKKASTKKAAARKKAPAR